MADDNQGDRSGKGGDEEQEERTDGWMTTYADMVTLLMTFFVLMFAISNVDNEKAMLFFAGMSRDGLSVAQFDRIVDMFNPGDDPGIYFFGAGWDDDNDDDPGEDAEDGAIGNPEMEELHRLMTEYIVSAELGGSISLTFNGEFLLMTLANDVLFDSGRAEVKPEMRHIAESIAQVIAGTHNPDNPFEIVVVGHTDNVPINTPEFPSNWFVSVRRAANFMEILIRETGVDPFYFRATGVGEYRPIDTNDTAEGRQRNRRVEVLISIDNPNAE